MMPSNERLQKALHGLSLILLFFVIGCCIYIRLKNYWNNPSFFIDEANLACNVGERGIVGFWRELDYSQYAPPLFMVLSKILVELFGYHEYVFRLLPMLSIFVSFWGLFLLHKKFSRSLLPLLVVFALFGMSYSNILLSYSFKQYTLDLAITLGLTLYTLKRDYSRFFERKELVIWSILGSLLVWTSMPVVFVLASIGAYFAWQAYNAQAFFKWVLRFSIPVVCWLINFGAYFLMILNVDVSESYLQDYHKMYFLSAELWNNESLTHNWQVMRGLLSYYTTDLLLMQVLFWVFYGIGCAKIWKQQKEVLILLVLPFVLALVSSMTGYYSLIGRLVLFTFPLQILLVGIGLSAAWEAKAIAAKAVAVLVGLFFVYNMNGWNFLFNNHGIVYESTRNSVEYIATHKKENERLLTLYQSRPILQFYTKHYKYKERFSACKEYETILEDGNEHTYEKVQQELERSPSKQIWFLLGHLEEWKAAQRLEPIKQDPSMVIIDEHKDWRTQTVQIKKVQ